MNKQSNQYLSRARKAHHLKLNDLAYLLKINQGNLSNFEAGKISSPKALIGYHILLNISIESSIKQVFEGGFKQFIDRCFLLIERVEEGPKTAKNRLRIEGLHTVVTRLMEFDKAYV